MQPDVSVAMAVANDYHRPEWTIQVIRTMQSTLNVEFVVCDNYPDSAEGKRLAKKINGGNYAAGTAGVVYTPFVDPKGTAGPRDHAIRTARGKIVLCIDSHIILQNPEALERLVRWFKDHPDFHGIVSGPIVMDDLETHNTHFNPVWRGGMFGVWGRSFEFKGEKFSTVETEAKRVRYVRLDQGANLVDSPVAETLPVIPWYGHEAVLIKEFGCRELGLDPDDEFEVPGQGLGLFAFRKNDWPGFNPLMRGFGGEELYIHEKFRRRGGPTMCLGFLPWWHSFGDANYNVMLEDKTRNNVLTHEELGWDLQPVKDHFIGTGNVPGVKDKQLPEAFWEKLMEDPTKLPEYPKTKSQTQAPQSIEDAYAGVVANKDAGYFSEHLPLIRLLSGLPDSRVVEVTRYAETSVGVLAAKPKETTSFIYGGHDNPVYKTLMHMTHKEGLVWKPQSVQVIPETIPECEMLVYVTASNCETLKQDLVRWLPSLKRRVALHDTQRNGLNLDNGRPGYWPQIQDFLQEHPEWFIMAHNPNMSGMTYLSSHPEDKPKQMIIPWPVVDGVGGAVKARIATIGVRPTPTCTCNKLINYMNMIGVDQVEKEFDALRERIRENWKSHGLVEKLEAVAAGVLSVFTSATPWQLDDKTDPVGSLLRLGIKDERERLARLAKEVKDGE